MKTVTTKEYGYVVIGSESTVMINSLYSHAEKEEAKKEAIRLSKENPNEYFYVLEIHNRTNTAEDIVYDEEQSSEITDYGQSVCCEKGRIRYRGGSSYYCDWCGGEEIRPCFSLGTTKENIMGKFYKNSIEIEIKELANIIVDLRIKYGEIPAVIKLQDIYDEYAKGKKHYE